MGAPASDKQTLSPPEASNAERMKHTQAETRIPAIIVGVVAAFVIGLSLFYLLRSEPLLVQGEADATRFDIAARVDGRVKEIPVKRGQDVAANAVLVRFTIPRLWPSSSR
jgi:HlyD family secretion protein